MNPKVRKRIRGKKVAIVVHKSFESLAPESREFTGRSRIARKFKLLLGVSIH